jgi:TonB family protein
MKSGVSEMVVEEWQPPAALPGKQRGARHSRNMLMWAAVLLVHGLLIWELAAWAPRRDTPARTISPIVATLIVDDGSPESGDRSSATPITPLELPIGETEPSFPPADAWPSDEESSSAASNDFAPPTLMTGSPDTAPFAALAGIDPGKSVRVILSVNVTEFGEAGEVRVVVGSGSPAADDVAVKYARALRWSPARVQGRPSRMNIRLPVVLAAQAR